MTRTADRQSRATNDTGASVAAPWTDLFVRTDAVENAPSNRVGALVSPDIIPAGTSPVIADRYLTQTSYGTYYNIKLEGGRPNYIYVRARNVPQTSPNSGTVSLVMSNPAGVPWPGGDKWTRIKTASGAMSSALEPCPTPASDISVTRNDPFVIVPAESGPWSFVTWLSTSNHPEPCPPPRLATPAAVTQFLIEHPNYAQHDMDLAPDTSGAVTGAASFTSGSIVASWTFVVRTLNCADFAISLSEGTPLPHDKFIGFKDVIVPITRPIVPVSISTQALVPANWTTIFYYTYDPRGMKPTNPSVTFLAFLDVAPGDPRYESATPYEGVGVARDRIRKDDSGAQFRGLLNGSIDLAPER